MNKMDGGSIDKIGDETKVYQLKGKELPKIQENLGAAKSTLETKKFEGQNNTLGIISKGLANAGLIPGMMLKSAGKAAGTFTLGVTLAVVALPATIVGSMGGMITYGGSRMLGYGHAEALKHAKFATVGAGAATAAILSLVALPFSLTAWCVKGLGSALMKPADKENIPEPFKKFDESVSTHFFPLFGRFGKETDELYKTHNIKQHTSKKITRTVAALFDEKIVEYNKSKKAEDKTNVDKK